MSGLLILVVVALVTAAIAIMVGAFGWGAPSLNGTCATEKQRVPASNMRIAALPAQWQPSTLFEPTPTLAPASQLYLATAPDLNLVPSSSISLWVRCPDVILPIGMLVSALDSSSVVSSRHAIRLLDDFETLLVSFGTVPVTIRVSRIRPSEWFHVVWQFIPGPTNTLSSVAVNGLTVLNQELQGNLSIPLDHWRFGSIGTQDVRVYSWGSVLDFGISEAGIATLYNNGQGTPLSVPSVPDVWYQARGPVADPIPNDGSDGGVAGAALVTPGAWIEGHVPDASYLPGMPELALFTGSVTGNAVLCKPPVKMRLFLRSTTPMFNPDPPVGPANTPPVQTDITVQLAFNSNTFTQTTTMVAAIDFEPFTMDVPIPSNLREKGDVQFTISSVGQEITTAVSSVQFL